MRRKRQVRNAIVQEVIVGIKKKARAQVDAKQTTHRTFGQSVKQNWDCSQVENEEEEEDEDWQEGDQMEMHWADEKWEEILERRRAEGGSLQAEVLQKVLELVVRERISQGEKAKGTEEKIKMKDGPPRR